MQIQQKVDSTGAPPIMPPLTDSFYQRILRVLLVVMAAHDFKP